jgi:outer membrane protein
MKMKRLFIVGAAGCMALAPCSGYAQTLQVDQPPTAQSLPSAPVPQPVPNQTAPAMAPNQHRPSDSQANPGSPTTLSLKQAEALALKNNPQISVARLTALASQQVTRQVRSSLWPAATADLTGVDSKENSRITAGGLNNPIIYERAAVGMMVNQLITDFGRTTNLISSANLAAKAQDQNAVARKDQILLAVDQAFYGALQAHAVLTVAQQTVSARQTVADQVEALFKNKLRSQLDFSFAKVNLAQAKLLILDAENNENGALATLSMVLGYSETQNFQLVEDTAPINPPPGNVESLISQAFTMRPEILSLQFQEQSAQKFSNAERDLALPNIRAVGAIGDTPVRNPVLSNWYGAVGVNIEIPVFNGFLFSARSREASLRAQAAHDACLTFAIGSHAMSAPVGLMPTQLMRDSASPNNCWISQTSRSTLPTRVTAWG